MAHAFQWSTLQPLYLITIKWRNAHTPVHCSIVHNSQEVEAAQIIYQWLNE